MILQNIIRDHFVASFFLVNRPLFTLCLWAIWSLVLGHPNSIGSDRLLVFFEGSPFSEEDLQTVQHKESLSNRVAMGSKDDSVSGGFLGAFKSFFLC